MKSTLIKIERQEINDLKILYKMFGDSSYKEKYEKLEEELDKYIAKVVLNSKKYVLITNAFQEDKKDKWGMLDVTAHYITLVKVEDKEKGMKNVWSLLEGLGEIEWMSSGSFLGSVNVQIKNGYFLTISDYTNGVVE